jgi:YidC/Oxa1 family membrane protein insertase
VDRNLLLAFALSFLVLTTWTMLQERQAEEAGARQAGSEERPGAGEPSLAYEGVEEGTPAYPELPAAVPELPVADRAPSFEAQPESARRVSIETDVYRAELSSLGASIDQWELRKYRDKQGEPVLLAGWDRTLRGAVATPFLELGYGDLGKVNWEVESATADAATFWVDRDGVRIRKHYQFTGEGDYAFRVRLEVENASQKTVAPRFLLGWPDKVRDGSDFVEASMSVLHNGEVTTELLGGLGQAGFFSDAEPVHTFSGEVDWVGATSSYFLAAILPDAPSAASARFVAVKAGEVGLAEVYFNPVELPPGQRATREYRVYAGPKEMERLEALGGGVAQSIDLGWSWVAPLTRLFGWLLQVLNSFIGNYGVSIVLLTILVRVVTAPLTIKQMRSMERMKLLQPKMKEIQEKFADDRQRQSEEMMKLYKQEKVNPLAGCFPMLLQLPVFIGLFYALRSSIQLRQAPFVGWIDDLSAPDELFIVPGLELPFRVLPLMMGASMWLQQKITPMQQMDPAQARMMMIVMPIMMTVLLYGFPSGLALYWMMSNVLGIVHQLWIGRHMRPAKAE